MATYKYVISLKIMVSSGAIFQLVPTAQLHCKSKGLF